MLHNKLMKVFRNIVHVSCREIFFSKRLLVLTTGSTQTRYVVIFIDVSHETRRTDQFLQNFVDL